MARITGVHTHHNRTASCSPSSKVFQRGMVWSIVHPSIPWNRLFAAAELIVSVCVADEGRRVLQIQKDGVLFHETDFADAGDKIGAGQRFAVGLEDVGEHVLDR